MKKNTIAGIIISCACIWFAVRGINFAEVEDCFRSVRYGYLLPVLAAVLCNLFVRSYRWGVMINNLVRLDQVTLFRFTAIGFMAIGVLPARLGEFVRPYLVKQHSGVRMSATMATVVLERLFDLLTLMVILFLVIMLIPLPGEVKRAGSIMLAVSLSLFIVFIVIGTKRELSSRMIGWLLGFLPERLARPAAHYAESFLDGLQLLPDIKRTAWVMLLSGVIWVLLGISNYLMFYAFGMHLSWANAFAVLAIVALGVMIPAAPGFIGTFHYACLLGLTAFGIAKSEAFSYAVALWFMQMAPVVFLGLMLLPFQKLTLGGLMKRAEAGAEDTAEPRA